MCQSRFGETEPAGSTVRNTAAPVRVLDLRPRREFERSHLPGASRLAADEIDIPFLRPHRRRLLVAAASSAEEARSGARRLRALGYAVLPLDAPISRWPGPWEEGPERFPSWEPSPLLRRHRPGPAPGSAAVDLACGSGRDAVFLSLLGFEVVGIDRLHDALERGRYLADRHGVRVRWIQADIERDPAAWHGPWDLIHLHRFLDRPSLPLLAERLAPGGRLFAETFLEPQAAAGRRPRDPRHLLRRGELWTAIRSLAVLEYREGIDSGGDWTAAVAARRRTEGERHADA